MCDLTAHGQNTVAQVLRDILEHCVPAGNGGYVAQFGPVTYVRILDVVEVVDPVVYAGIIDALDAEREKDRGQ